MNSLFTPSLNFALLTGAQTVPQQGARRRSRRAPGQQPNRAAAQQRQATPHRQWRLQLPHVRYAL